ncbi:cell division protein FtsW [Oxalobacteraceae bacterium GrIS 1.11]
MLNAVPWRATAVAGAAAVIVLTGLQALCLWRAPPAWFPAAINVTLAPGESVMLGQRELAAPQAERRHIALRRDALGAWWMRKLSAGKQVIVQTAAGEQAMGSARLRSGQVFQLGPVRFDVEAVDATSVSFTHAGRHWLYDGAVLYRDGRAQAPCPDAHFASRATALWNRAAPAALTLARPLVFGGNLYCDNRLGAAELALGAATLARVDGHLRLAGGNPDGEAAALSIGEGARTVDLRDQEQALAGVQAIVLGYTRFQLLLRDGRLSMLPSRRVSLFGAPDLPLAPSIQWEWRQRTLWSGTTALWLALAGAAGALLARTSGGQWRGAALASALLLGAGIGALAMQRAGQAPGAACSMALGALALWLWLAVPARLPLATAAGVALLGVGLLAQLELGLGGMESSWLRYYQKSAAMLAIGSALAAGWQLWRQHNPAIARQCNVEWTLALYAAVALAALALQVLCGDEQGVFDVQPVELAKLALTALSAHCLALRLGWQSADGARWLRLIAPALLFLALLGAALVQVDDYSPLILLLVWATGMALAYALAARNGRLAAVLGCLVLATIGAIAGLRLAGADDALQWPRAGGFYAERFLVWLDPAEHPHTGRQLLLGARAIGAGGWWGADQWLGLASLGQSAGAAIHIPAVQDDFAAAFFLNRHGLIGALLLWALQAAFMVGILHIALDGHAAGAGARDHRQAWQGRFRYFLICGGAAFVLGHFLLSWGTNLAIFPIMGQPMSFLSAGGSHLLFFLCPLLAFCALSAPSLEENESCRSMSSTKS